MPKYRVHLDVVAENIDQVEELLEKNWDDSARVWKAIRRYLKEDDDSPETVADTGRPEVIRLVEIYDLHHPFNEETKNAVPRST